MALRVSRDFQMAYEFVLAEEGGFVDHPKDPGGATYAGVSLRAVVGLRDENGKLEFDLDGDGDVDKNDLRVLERLHKDGSDSVLQSFYWGKYWVPTKCDSLYWPVSLFLFDAAVNHGPKAGVVLLQRALGADEDGIVGPKTIERATITPVPILWRKFLVERAWLYYQLSVKRGDQFYRGWMKRLFDLQAEALRKGAR